MYNIYIYMFQTKRLKRRKNKTFLPNFISEIGKRSLRTVNHHFTMVLKEFKNYLAFNGDLVLIQSSENDVLLLERKKN